jgi:hypothetical protein
VKKAWRRGSRFSELLKEADMKVLSFTFLFILFICTMRGIAYADSFRCGNEVVLEGETKSTVTAKCGRPHWRDPEKKIHRGALKPSNSGAGQRPSTADRGKIVTIEKWFYDCGPDVFVTALTFEGGRLRKAEPGKQGSGNYKCRPTGQGEIKRTGTGKKDQGK